MKTSLLLVLCICICACTNMEQTETQLVTSDGGIKQNGEGLNIKFSAVQLNSDSAHLLANVSKVEICDTLIFVKDENGVYAFNLTGKFISTYGQKGHGQKEYISLTTFYIRDRQVVLVDSYNNTLLFFNFDGTFVNKIHIDEAKDNLSLANTHDIYVLPDDRLFVSNYIYNESNVVYTIAHSDSFKKEWEQSVPMQTKNTMEAVGNHPLSLYKNIARYILPFSNIIYSLSETNLEIQTSERVAEDKDIKKITDFNITTYLDFLNNELFIGYSDIFETEDMIFLGCKNLFYTLVDKTSWQAHKYYYRVNEESREIPLYNIISSDGKHLIGLFNPADSYSDNNIISILRSKCPEIMKRTDPVLLFYEIKSNKDD